MKTLQLQTIFAIISRLSKREKLVFYVAVVFVSLILLDTLIVSPINTKLRSLDDQIQEKELGIKKNLHILAQKNRITKQMADYAVFMTTPKSDKEEMTDLLKETESIASNSGVYLSDMKPGETTKTQTPKKYLVRLSCEAKMNQLTNFMYTLESSKKLLTIEKYQISPDPKTPGIVKCTMTITKILCPQ